jgi:ribosomal protein S18 acetylase RimI-like enzyme
MTSSVTVRPARAADLPAIGQLGAQLVAQHHSFDPERFVAPMPGLPGNYARFVERQLQLPGSIVLVAELSSAVVGYTYAGLEGFDYMALRGPAGLIYDLIVDEAHRRQGVGGALLEAALAALADLGAPRAVLSTAEKNAVAQRIFERAGFRRTMIEMTRELTTTNERPETGE